LQYGPDTARVLEVIGGVVSDVLDVVPDSHRHSLRVAVSLLAILQREAALDAEMREHERQLLSQIIGHDGDPGELTRELSARLRSGRDPDLEREVWHVMVEVTRGDLSIVRPGYSDWTRE
jgi:hypothetical protein